ncbi:Glu/Leu/Phe/Val dehydrogenase dimerization domain-containing protein [Geodermatophilus sp. SYSU D01106]
MTATPEQLLDRTGPRSGLTIAVAVDSTTLGPAIGGMRLRPYPGRDDAVADVLALARAMTHKCSLAGLDHGGGKTVVRVPPGPLAPGLRAAVLADVADLLTELGGAYLAGPDMGTGPDDMLVLHRLTGYAFCRPAEAGGAGDSAPGTAAGVLHALRAGARHALGSADLAGRTVGVLGYGAVGRRVADALLADGAEVHVADVDGALEERATRSGARWRTVAELLDARHDVLVPAAGGGLLDVDRAGRLHHRLVVGPANNQLATPEAGAVLAARGVTWVPDLVASAGGIVSTVAREELGLDGAAVEDRLRRIDTTTDLVLEEAARSGADPLTVALELSSRRLSGAVA